MAKKTIIRKAQTEDQVSKEITPKQSSAPAVATDLSAWGAPQKMSSRDIVIPKILAMQQMSDKVIKGQAKFGELRDTANNRLLGTLESPMEFIPFFMEKVFIEFELDRKGKRQFKRVVPITEANDNAPFEFEVDGVKWERDRTMNFYVLLPEDIKKGGAIPFIISCRRTSLRAGQKLATQMYVMNQSAGLPPAGVVCKLITQTKENDDGTFVVMDVENSRNATGEELNEAFKWFQPLAKGALKARVDNSDLEGGDAAEVDAPSDY